MTKDMNPPNDSAIDNTDTSDSTPPENHKGTTIYLILYDGHELYTVPAAFYSVVRNQVAEIIPAVERDVKYTLEMLCGEAFWKQLTDGEKRMAGRCMAQMIAKGLLPLRFAETKHEYPKRYQLH